MSPFERLTGALQYQIVHTLGFRELHPVQLQTIEAVLDGRNAVVLAPTAGGKTEAALFPLLSAMDAQDWRPVSVLYLSPIRALLNSQQDRAQRYAGLLGRRAFTWHGDTPPGERRRFLAAPADFLLTTPESLEAMLMSARIPARGLFSGLRAVIVDEVHAFAGDDRGAHLSALLERLSRFAGRDVQRIGLSATVGDPEAILRWMQGSSRRPGAVVNPGGERREPALVIDHVGTLENAARVIRALHPGRKRLVFVDSRRKAEQLGHELNQLTVQTFVSHGSLSVAERRDAERAFHEGSDCVIVATSALELGIDVGDLDHVLQIDAPATVASFLQRMGRTGRRAGGTSNCTFLATKDAAVLHAAAIVRLFREGYVEPARPARRAAHILAHQLMALAIQRGGVGRGDVEAWLEGATAFADLGAEERAAVLEHMLRAGILADHGGKLWLGPEGERRYGRAGFRALYAVFDTPPLLTVRWETQEVGTVDAQFLAAIDAEQERGSFLLAGRTWQIVHLDWGRGVCAVRPAPAGRAPRWAGSPRHLRREVCQAMRRILTEEAEDAAWSQRARRAIAAARAEHAFLGDEAAPMIERGEEITWWTFSGGAANLLLARMLEAALGGRCVGRNVSVTLQGDAGKSGAAVRDLLRRWREEGRPAVADARWHAEGAARSRISKFQACLPEGLLQELLAESALDVEGARGAVAETRAPR